MRKFVAYTDGSYNGIDGIAHGGIVWWDEKENRGYNRLHVFTTIPQFCSMRNVGGEIIAAWCAIKSVIAIAESKEEYKDEQFELELVYDYEGVGKWLTGVWRAKKRETQWYVASIKAMLYNCPNLKLTLTWVRGHQAVDGNEEADRVAAYDTTYCTRNNIQVMDITSLLQSETRW